MNIEQESLRVLSSRLPKLQSLVIFLEDIYHAKIETIMKS